MALAARLAVGRIREGLEQSNRFLTGSSLVYVSCLLCCVGPRQSPSNPKSRLQPRVATSPKVKKTGRRMQRFLTIVRGSIGSAKSANEDASRGAGGCPDITKDTDKHHHQRCKGWARAAC